jgi:hypothetical protein
MFLCQTDSESVSTTGLAIRADSSGFLWASKLHVASWGAASHLPVVNCQSQPSWRSIYLDTFVKIFENGMDIGQSISISGKCPISAFMNLS